MNRLFLLACSLLQPSYILHAFPDDLVRLDKGRLQAVDMAPEWKLPTLRLTVKPLAMEKLRSRRERALFENWLFNDGRFWVEGHVEFDGVVSKAEIRLKGNRPVHWKDAKRWSFRVHLKGETSVMGMSSFSLQLPSTRRDLWEWVACRAFAREHLVVGRYEFVHLIVNDSDYGIYAVEDSDHSLVEAAGRRDGPIVALDEDPIWEPNRQAFRTSSRLNFSVEREYLENDLTAMNSKALLKHPDQAALFEHAKARFDLFRRQQADASEIFDPERTGLFIALADLFGTRHILFPHNLHFYYDPLSARLELVGSDFDAGAYQRGPAGSISRTLRRAIDYTSIASFMGSINRDPVMHQAYREGLKKVTEPGYVEALAKDLEPEIRYMGSALEAQFGDAGFSWAPLYRNQAFLQATLVGYGPWPKNPTEQPQAARVVLMGVDGSTVKLAMANRFPVRLEVDEVVIGSGNERVSLTGKSWIPGLKPGEPLAYKKAEFSLPDGVSWKDAWKFRVAVTFKEPGTNNSYVEEAFPVHAGDAAVLEADTLLARAPFTPPVGWQDDHGVWVIPSGTSRIDKTLVVPEGTRIKAGPGSRLVLGAGASLISRSPLEWLGSAAAPVIVEAEKGGGGVAVLFGRGGSKLDQVQFKGLSNPVMPGTAYTGGVTFYRTDLEASHCLFEGARCEDSLNLVETHFQLSDSEVKNSFSDAIDTDSSWGSVIRTKISNAGNDALDFSGGHLNVSDVEIQGAGDKGISAGERTVVEGSKIRMRSGEIGVASKDGSRVTLDGLSISQFKLGFAVFQKKRDYGPAWATVKAATLEQLKTPWLVESASTLEVNGAKAQADDDAVRERLYGVDYGKASVR